MRITKLQFLKNNVKDKASESHEFIDVLERIYNKTRGQHNTVALITAAKQHKGLILTHNQKWADQLTKEHGIDATRYNDPKIYNYQGPILMDLPTMFKFVQSHSRLRHAVNELLEYLDEKGID